MKPRDKSHDIGRKKVKNTEPAVSFDRAEKAVYNDSIDRL